MSSDWRMPTVDEILELVQNTDHYYIYMNKGWVGPFNHETNDSDKGLDGSKLSSICFVKRGEAFDYNNRSNFIEFPFAGWCNGSVLCDDNFYGSVWSSSALENTGERACLLDFNSGGDIRYDINALRYYGNSVRGVKKIINNTKQLNYILI